MGLLAHSSGPPARRSRPCRNGIPRNGDGEILVERARDAALTRARAARPPGHRAPRDARSSGACGDRWPKRSSDASGQPRATTRSSRPTTTTNVVTVNITFGDGDVVTKKVADGSPRPTSTRCQIHQPTQCWTGPRRNSMQYQRPRRSDRQTQKTLSSPTRQAWLRSGRGFAPARQALIDRQDASRPDKQRGLVRGPLAPSVARRSSGGRCQPVLMAGDPIVIRSPPRRLPRLPAGLDHEASPEQSSTRATSSRRNHRNDLASPHSDLPGARANSSPGSPAPTSAVRSRRSRPRWPAHAEVCRPRPVALWPLTGRSAPAPSPPGGAR